MHAGRYVFPILASALSVALGSAFTKPAHTQSALSTEDNAFRANSYADALGQLLRLSPGGRRFRR